MVNWFNVWYYNLTGIFMAIGLINYGFKAIRFQTSPRLWGEFWSVEITELRHGSLRAMAKQKITPLWSPSLGIIHHPTLGPTMIWNHSKMKILVDHQRFMSYAEGIPPTSMEDVINAIKKLADSFMFFSQPTWNIMKHVIWQAETGRMCSY